MTCGELILVALLSVVFISGCSTPNRIELPLPSPDTESPEEGAAVVIGIDGSVSVGGETTTPGQLGAKLIASGLTKDSQITIQADKRVKYGAVVAVLDTLRNSGFNNIRFTAKN